MKKNVSVFSIILVLFFFITGCKNAFNGGELLDSLDKSIQKSILDYSNITIYANSEYTKSIYPAAGNYSDVYKVTDQINLIFDEKPTYSFIKWSFEPADSVTIVENTITDTQITIEIVQTGTIIIQPICEEKETLKINFASDHATLTPSDKKEYILDDTFMLDCREDVDYYFFSWMVLDSSGNEISDYSDILEFDNVKNQNTDVKVVGMLDDSKDEITLSPKLVKCPKVVSASPLYEPNGVFRNSKIVIMFDEEMSTDSIYFTDAELEYYRSKNYTLLEHKSYLGKYYGYIDENQEIHYKNIKITQYTNKNENLLKYFGAPAFDINNRQIIRISVNKDLTPPSALNIMVTLDKSFGFYNEETDSLIPLNSDYSFTYRTNSETDNVEPFIGSYNYSEDYMQIYIVPDANANTNTQFNKNWISLFTSATDIEAEDIESHCLHSKKLWVRGRVSDGDSGVYKVEYRVAQTTGAYYSPYGQFAPVQKSVSVYSEDYGTDIQIDKMINLSEIDFAQGFYSLVIIATDYSGNEKVSEPFYFVYDPWNYGN